MTIDTSPEAVERLAKLFSDRWPSGGPSQVAATLRALAAERDALLAPRGYQTCAHCGGQNGWIEADMAAEIDRRCAAASHAATARRGTRTRRGAMPSPPFFWLGATADA